MSEKNTASLSTSRRVRQFLSVHLPEIAYVQYRRFGPDEVVQPHAHADLYQLDYCPEGEGAYVIQDETRAVDPLTWFLIAPTQMHRIESAATMPLMNLTVKFRLPGLDLPAPLPSMLALDGERSQKASQLFRELVSAAVLNTPDHRLTATLRLTELLAILLRAIESALMPAETHPLVLRAQRFMQDRAHERLTLPDVAAAVGVSAEHLCRVFRRRAGVTVLNYLRQLRVDKARTWLQTTNRSIREVAEGVGFDSPKDMNRAFQRIVGASPRAYRKHARDGTPRPLPA